MSNDERGSRLENPQSRFQRHIISSVRSTAALAAFSLIYWIALSLTDTAFDPGITDFGVVIPVAGGILLGPLGGIVAGLAIETMRVFDQGQRNGATGMAFSTVVGPSTLLDTLILVGVGLISGIFRNRLMRERRRLDALTGPALEATDRNADRQRTENELRANEALYRELFDDAPVGYHELDSDGCITRVNETELTMLGYTREEMLGRPIFEFIVNAEVDIARASYQLKLQSTGPMSSFERRYRRHDGTEIPLLLEDRILRDESGKAIGVRTTLQDISALKEVEEKIRVADNLKSEFVSLVSHELRTPLTSIKGYVDLLIAGEVGDLEEEQREFLGIVKSNADRLVSLINDLLDVSRIESGKIELQRRPTDMAQLVKNVAQSMRPQIDARNQTLRLDLPDHAVIGLVDADRMTQVVTNLLSNAHKYTPSGGHLTMVLRNEGTDFRLDVTDTGIGLSEDDLSHLFGRFWRAPNNATREVGGTGLGLVITRSLIEMHGGAITVTSTPGVGSTFTVILPVLGLSTENIGLSAIPPPSEARSQVNVPHGERILVVEDEPEIAQLIRRYLENGGYSVLIARNGVEALKMARAQQPDLITLDILLPGVDGFAVLDWLRNDPLTATIAVVVLSITEDSERGRTLGAADYITKPVEQGELLQRVGAILERNFGCRVVVPAGEGNELNPISTSS